MGPVVDGPHARDPLPGGRVAGGRRRRGGCRGHRAAIEAARRAFDSGPWPHTPAAERSALLLRLADILEREVETIARAESLDTGKRIVEARYDVADVVRCFRYFAGVAQGLSGRLVETGDAGFVSRIVYEPVGVCGLITPWNYPLLQASWKVGPALAAGNTFVIKPSELTPSTTILLMRYLQEAGLPDGVGNLVLGRRAGGRRAAERAPGRRPGLVHRRTRHGPGHHGRPRPRP